MKYLNSEAGHKALYLYEAIHDEIVWVVDVANHGHEDEIPLSQRHDTTAFDYVIHMMKKQL